MLNFRYHALSIVAVLVALTVGLLLGVAIGDKNLVSSAEQDLRANLRKEISSRQKTADGLRSELTARGRFENAVYPLLVGGQLQGTNVGLIFLGNSSQEVTSLTRQALRDTGASLRISAAVREPLDLDGLARRAKGTRYETMNVDPTLIDPFGDRMGGQLVNGGGLIKRERTVLFRSSSGSLDPLGAVIVVRDQPKMSATEQKIADTFEVGFMRGLRGTTASIVGVERSGTDPTQIPWYRSHGASSVDNLDSVDGRAALVFALAGANGAFGTGPDAQALLPAVVGGVRQP